MKTLHTAYRVSDLERSLAFYAALGFREMGRVTTDEALLTLLNLDGDGDIATLELVYEPDHDFDVGSGFSHLVVQVEALDDTLRELARGGIAFEPAGLPGGENGPRTAFLNDPDGWRIELVQWPAGHPDGLTRADFA